MTTSILRAQIYHQAHIHSLAASVYLIRNQVRNTLEDCTLNIRVDISGSHLPHHRYYLSVDGVTIPDSLVHETHQIVLEDQIIPLTMEVHPNE